MPATRFGVSMEGTLLRRFDRFVRRRYRNRSEAVRDLARAKVVEEEWEAGEDEVVGCITLVYDHRKRELSHLLTRAQHRQQHLVICSTHVQLNGHNCLQVVVARGKPVEVAALADQLISTKGVKHGKLVRSTTGRGLA